MDNQIQSNDPDESNSSKLFLRKNGMILRPVAENESGEGLPYAPSDWPEPGDVWRWKVGFRINSSGYWTDRYLYLPARLQKALHKRSFASRLSVKDYVQNEFPDADIDAFFSSFSWRIPATGHTSAEGQTTISGTNFTGKTAEHPQSESKVETVDCKAGNWMCRLQLQAQRYSLPSMDCAICCSETGFCRDCCCILCCKVVDWAYGGYSFIRCEAKVNDKNICGHVAHVECALHSYMAGTVGGNSGLDVEYYCRRCDKRSDLIVHVEKLVQTCESLDSQDDIEKILNVGLCILGGSQQESSKRLLHNIELALAKLKNRSCLENVRKSGDNEVAVSAGYKSHAGSNGSLHGTIGIAINQNQRDSVCKLDQIQHTQQPVTSNRIVPSELEKKIEKALRDLRNSQEYEYRIAKERLCAQKDFILGLYRQLETERSELANMTSTSTDCNVDTVISNIVNKVNQIKREIQKLKDMEEVAKGFGRVPKVLLKENFGLHIAE